MSKEKVLVAMSGGGNWLKIAFFDSGIGGLSVLHHAMKILPNEEFIFFADEDNVPYGVKSREQVLSYVDAAFKFLTAQNVGAIVVACNTATSVAVRPMREKYSARKNPFEIVGQALHSHTLSLTHPTTRERMNFIAPLPDDMEKILKYLREDNR